MVKKGAGRPRKYRHLILCLDDDVIYSPAMIAEAVTERIVIGAKQRRRLRERIRIALANYARSHGFPVDGDGRVKRLAQREVSGWTGHRWKATYGRN